jgi:hypothetical protein
MPALSVVTMVSLVGGQGLVVRIVSSGAVSAETNS